MKFFLLMIFIFLSACSTERPKDIENYFQSAGTEKYILSDLPDWANFSETGVCKRNSAIKFFDIDLLMKNYAIDFKKAISIQASFNEEYNNIVEKNPKKPIPLNDEQLLFFKAFEKNNAGISYFSPPQFKKINLVSIDSISKGENEILNLKKFLNSKIFDLAPAVLISYCYTKKEIESIFNERTYPVISIELLSIFKTDGSRGTKFSLPLETFFTKDVDLNLYLRAEKKIEESSKIKNITF